MNEFWGAISEWLTGTSDIRAWNWGSVAEWTTGILTAVAVIITVVTFRTEARRIRSEQARLLFATVHCVPQNEKESAARVTVMNHSSQRLMEIEIIFSMPNDERRKRQISYLRDDFPWVENFTVKKYATWILKHVWLINWRSPLDAIRRVPIYKRSSLGNVDAGDDQYKTVVTGSSQQFVAIAYRDASGQAWMRDVQASELMSERARRRVLRHAH